ncbi:CHAT domain-containing protein [Anatilimnocola floriformis]|uniref:CHAT domain-containing protein n=1 Tax=Anatilimnocola floriformis TaxID=2948575 RepID=UPI0020C3A594|nr:CHAT domain-containing protein [Anatilimnocola floriformis]
MAEAKYRAALQLRIARHGLTHIDTATVLDSIVRLYAAQGRWQEAETFCRYELAAYEKSAGKDHIETTKATLRMANVLTGLGRASEAEVLARQVVDRLTKEFGADNSNLTQPRHELCKALFQQEKFAELEPLLRQNIAAQEKSLAPNSANLVAGITMLSYAVLNQGRSQEALDLLNRLAEVHERSPLSPQSLENLLGTRAAALWMLGQKEAAVAELARSQDQTELLQTFSPGAERERAEMFLSRSTGYELAIDWQAQLKNIPQLFAAMERAKARTFLDELKLKNIDLLAGISPQDRQLLTQQEEKLRRELTAVETRFNELPELPPIAPAAEMQKRKDAAAEVLAARDALYQHFARLRSASPVYRELIQSKTGNVTLEQVQGRLGEGELLLSYSVGENQSYVVCVRKDSAQFHRLELDEATAKTLGARAGDLNDETLVTTLLDKTAGVLGMISNPKRKSEDASGKLAALWTALIPAAEKAQITSGEVKRLVIIPDGALALLPFETLVVENDTKPQYLLDVGPPIAYAPSAAVLLNLVDRPVVSATDLKLFTLGDPTYAPPVAADPLDRTLAAVRTIDRFRAGLSRLPFTAQESSWVRQHLEKIGFSTVRVTEAKATEAAIRQHAPGKQIIHFACHGMADQSYGNFFGSLAIAPGRAGDSRDDGFLSMAEIYDLDLTGCELAILSACETNYGPQQKGEGVWALSRGFLVAGSRRVVASNWVVDDRAGATLISLFAGHLALAGKDSTARDYATALHKAKKEVRKDERWQQPFYWSSLVLVGPK